MSLTPSPRKRKAILSSVREPLRTLILLFALVVPGVLGGFVLVAAVMFTARNLGTELSFVQAFNAAVCVFLILVFLPICHAGLYRWFWHVEAKKRSHVDFAHEKIPPTGSEPTEPPPPLKPSLSEKLGYALLYAGAIALLLFIFMPLGHQEALNRFIARYSSGRTSAASLATLVIVTIPMIIGMAAMALYMQKDKQRIELRLNWLAAFVPAVIMTGLLCFFVGNLTLRYLA